MPDEKPSWQTSTTSQILVTGVSGYLIICLWLAFKGQLTEAMSGMRWLVETALVLYGYRTGIREGKNGNAGGTNAKPGG